ncbi:MAG: M48 family metalloprotease [Pseudomonadota bacterium]
MLRTLRNLVLAGGALAAVSACAPNTQNTAESIRAEQVRAQQLVAQLDQKGALIKDRRLNNYVRGIVDRVSKQRPPGSVPLRAYIIKDADVNAFTPGGGYVFFNAGMLAAMENEAQLAMVTAHEIAHIDRGHIQAGQATRTGVQIGAEIASALGQIGAQALGIPGQLVNLGVSLGSELVVNSFSRSQETDADTTGVGYMAAAGYNAIEGAKSFKVLKRLYGDNSGPEALFFSSHPASSDRLANLTSLGQQLGATGGRVAANTYDNATRSLRREVLAVYESAGRSNEAAQIRRNLR